MSFSGQEEEERYLRDKDLRVGGVFPRERRGKEVCQRAESE